MTMHEFSKEEVSKVMKSLIILIVVIAVFFIFKIAETAREYRYIGSGMAASNVITVTGSGEVFALPDIATIGFTVRNEGANVKIAQDATTAKMDEVLAKILELGIDDKDVKTTSYSSNPKYSYTKYGYYPVNQGTIIGYEVAQTIEVKIRDTAQTGDVLGLLGTAGVSETYGPNYAIDNEDGLKADARKQAIDEAEMKAKDLASKLGVTLVRIVGFSENGDYPIYGKAYDMMTSTEVAQNAIPDVPTGQSQITSDVTITYEIR